MQSVDPPPSGKLLEPDDYRRLIIANVPAKLTRPRDVRFSGDGKYLVIAADGGGDVRSGAELRLERELTARDLAGKDSATDAMSADFAMDASVLAFAYVRLKNDAITNDWRVVIADWKKAEVLRTLKADSLVESLRFSVDGRRLVAGCKAGKDRHDLKVWNVESGEVEHQEQVIGDGSTYYAEFSRDGKHLVARSGLLTSAWNTDTWKRVQTEHDSTGVAFDREGRILAVVARRVHQGDDVRTEGTLTVLDPSTLTPDREIKIPYACSSRHASSHPTLDYLAFGSGNTLVIAHTRRDLQYAFHVPAGPAKVAGIHFSPDGKKVAFLVGGSCVLLNTEWLSK